MPWIGIAIIALFLVVLGVVIPSTIAANAKRKAEIEALFKELGLTFIRKPDAATRDAYWAPFAALKQLKHGAKGIKWLATGTIDGHPVTAILHSYTISTGQSAQQIIHLCVSCPCPSHWPMVTLKGEHFLHRLADKLGATDLDLESEAFNRRWRVSTDDEDHAIMLLNPEVQALLAESPPAESWMIGRGWVRLMSRGQKRKPADMRATLVKPGQLLDLIAPELFVDLHALKPPNPQTESDGH